MSQIDQKRSTIFVLGLALLLGFYVRLSSVLAAGYPVNDGGMFYSMTVDLQNNHYLLPATASYNGAGIPFAYPPLAFYLAALLSNLGGWNLIDVFRILPAIISMAALPGLYLLARDLLKSEAQAAIACLIFALTPGAFFWLIMGGGITRGLGLAFALMTLHEAYLMYDKREIRYALATALFAAGTVLSHPEMAVHTVASALLLFIFWGRSKRGFWLSVLTAGLTFLLTAPWWVSLLQNHGVGPVVAAMQTGQHSLDEAAPFFLLNFSQETSLTIIGCLALIGLFLSLSQKNTFLVSWLVIIYVSEPRSASLYILPLFSMFAALSLHQIVFPGLQPEKPRPAENAKWAQALLASGVTKLVFAFLLAYLLLVAMSISAYEGSSMVLGKNDIQAIAWVKQNVPTNSRFLILTGEMPMTDTLSEWFPALTGRVSLATVQGYEWMAAGRLFTKLAQYDDLQACLNHEVSCVRDWSEKTAQEFDYIIIRPNATSKTVYMLKTALDRSSDFQAVFDQPGISIFVQRRP